MSNCQTCGYDATYYGERLRPFEGLNICRGCYLDVNDISREYLDKNWTVAAQIRREFAANTVAAA